MATNWGNSSNNNRGSASSLTERRSTMARKDFEIIAQIVALYQSENYYGQREGQIDSLLRSTNQNYDSARFWGAVKRHAEK